MKPVACAEILDPPTWATRRDAVRQALMPARRLRRVEVGAHLTVCFENRDSVRYAVQELVGVERLVDEDEIRAALERGNARLGGPGSLAATVLIDAGWDGDGAPRVYLRLADGRKVFGTGGGDLGARDVIFAVGGEVPVAVGVEGLETPLSPICAAALAADLRGDGATA